MTVAKSISNKIITDLSKIKPFLKKWRRGKKKIVLTQGSFDMVHIGHARYCKEAKHRGDVLIVGTDSDEKIKKRKGSERPIVPEEERLEMMAYLDSVDLVVLKQLDWPKYHLIKTIKPDILVATEETYDKDQIKELKEYCGKIVVLKRMATTTTSAKLRLMQIKAARKISSTLQNKLISTIEEAFRELKGED